MRVRTTDMTPADYEQVLAFWRRQEGVGLNDCDTRKGITSYLKRNPGLSLISRDGGKVIAAVLCGHDGRRGYLHHLAVAPSHRGKRIGRALVRTCLRRLRRLGINKCNVFVFGKNSAAQDFWRAIGFNARDDLKLMQKETRATRETPRH